MMEKRNSILTNPLFIFICVFLVGFLATVVIITRWLWPVQWIDAAPQNLNPDAQEEYLRMAIDSYAVNPDSSLAMQRYAGLGDYAPEVLAEIAANPDYQNPAEIASFTTAIEQQGQVPPPPTYPIANIWRLLGLLFGLLFVVIIIYFVYELWQKRQQEKAEAEAAAAASTGAEVAETTAMPWDTQLEEESSDDEFEWEESQETVEQTTAFEETIEEDESAEFSAVDAAALGAAALGAAALVSRDDEVEEETEEQLDEDIVAAEDEFELPEWLKEFEEGAEEEDTDEIDLEGLIGTGALGAAAAAAISDDESEEVEAEVVFLDEEEVGLEQVEASIAPEDMAKFHYSMDYIEGVGPQYASQLEEIGISTPLDLLHRGATPTGRKHIADESGISSKLILRWVNHVDLYRIKGVGSEYADLLEAAGVDTVVELATRVPANLHASMVNVNEEKSLVRQLPTLSQVEEWVGQAKSLPRVVKY